MVHMRRSISNVYVKITDEESTFFLHLISDDTVRNEVEVKTRVYPATENAYGMTLLALNEDDDKNGLDIHKVVQE